MSYMSLRGVVFSSSEERFSASYVTRRKFCFNDAKETSNIDTATVSNVLNALLSYIKLPKRDISANKARHDFHECGEASFFLFFFVFFPFLVF